MKKQIIKNIFLFLLLMNSICANSQIIKNEAIKLDLYTEKPSNPFYGLSIQPLFINVNTHDFNVGINTNFIYNRVANSKFSIFSDFSIYYRPSSLGNDPNSPKFYSSLTPTLIPFTGEFGFGYLINEKVITKKRNVFLGLDRGLNNSKINFYTDLNLKYSYQNILKVGLNFNREYDVNSFIHNSIASFIIGFNQFKSVYSVFKSEAFNYSTEGKLKQFYFDLHIALPSKFSYIQSVEGNTIKQMSIADQNAFRKTVEKLPVGFKVGYKGRFSIISSKITDKRVYFMMELGLNPSYKLKSSMPNYYAICGLGYGIFKIK